MNEEQPQVQPQASKKPEAVVALSILTVLLAIVTGFTYTQWQKSENQLKTSKAQVVTISTELRAATGQLATYRDAQRKTDLASLVNVIRTYNTANHGHLTTEGSMSENIYETQLSKSIDNFKDPKTGDTYGFVGVAEVQSPPPLKVGTIQYQWPGKCGAKTLEDTSDETLSAVATLLENGSMYCLQI